MPSNAGAARSAAATISLLIAGLSFLAAARAQAPPAPFRDCAECPEMIAIPAGAFTMGSNVESGPYHNSTEKPQRSVSVPAFLLGKYEVTFDEWDACVAAQGCTHRPGDRGWGRGRRPVILVSWEDAKQYVDWLSRKTGKAYRLTSEAEWEYAARGGTTTHFWWGDAPGRNNANCFGCGSQWDDRQTAPVGSFPPNPFGLHDLLGNAKEWVEDCWVTNSYSGAPSDGSAWVSGPCKLRMLRGGSFMTGSNASRAASRSLEHPGERRNFHIGFRVARSP
jgi:formylglycine-generating enzyme required for sulfatase activity